MNENATVYIVYDDRCPFCRNYCQLVRLRDTVQNVTLIDARQPSAIMDRITDQGLDIDRGMVVIVGDDLYYGSEAIHVLALLSTRSDFFNHLTYLLFKSKKGSAFLYPFLRDCRNLALWLMRIPLIRNLEKP